MLSTNVAFPLLLLLSRLGIVSAFSSFEAEGQQPLLQDNGDVTPSNISVGLFASLERFARLVDIAYCVGTSGITKPFNCASWCKDFPTLSLVTTWNTGILMSDSCGYIAVDHGAQQQPPSSPTSASHASNGGGGSEGKGAILIAFRGTYSIANTIVDLSTVPQEYMPYPAPDDGSYRPPKEPKHTCNNCTVHMGFMMSWRNARKDVLPALKPLLEKYPEYTVHLIGHSLGGAVAALAALELKVSLGRDNLVVTTFGEPRAGNDEFAKYLDSVFQLDDEGAQAGQQTYRRVTHVDDPVPLLPLVEWGYSSHAGEIFIAKSDLPPEPSDIRHCHGDYDPSCIAGSDGERIMAASRDMAAERMTGDDAVISEGQGLWEIPTRFRLWELLFAHREYFWRLGLCIPGGDPSNWGREIEGYPNINDEL
ncbi:Alpha/Beta hydrolase protein [Biscogniauxia mediterranea]|nr:Alpha/Beta hydrolase protein [Biscogniauxia mediterranea]